MRYPTRPLDEQLKDIRKTIVEALGKLDDATQEKAAKTVGDLLPSSSNDASRLVPFSGYYGISDIEGNPAPSGAFLSIDTTEVCINWPVTINWPVPESVTIRLNLPIITISVSLDGETSTSYLFDNNASFDDNQTLTIGNALQVTLTRGYQGGHLVSFSGSISAQTISRTIPEKISGSTYFNPVELPVFAGTYKETKTAPAQLTVAADSSLAFNFGGGLQNIPVFTYDPAMYVVIFENDDVSYTLMLGTYENSGLACFITYGTNTDYVVTIPSK